MQEIGVRLGADVPALFYDKPIIARGIGEKIEEINQKLKYYLVLIKPGFLCDTEKLYGELDNTKDIKQEYNTEIVKNSIINKDVSTMASNLYNVFENCLEGIEEMKEEMLSLGALGALMTGAGSCVYGIFLDKDQAKKAFKILKDRYEAYFSLVV